MAQIRAVVDFPSTTRSSTRLPLFHSSAHRRRPAAGAHRAKVFLYHRRCITASSPELAYDRNCTVLLGTSTFLGNYAKFAHPYDFYRLRYVIAGAEALPPGASCGSRSSGSHLRRLRRHRDGAGAGGEQHPDGLPQRHGQAVSSGLQHRLLPVPGIATGGMLHVKGPNLMSGYLRFENPGVLQTPRRAAGEAGTRPATWSTWMPTAS